MDKPWIEDAIAKHISSLFFPLKIIKVCFFHFLAEIILTTLLNLAFPVTQKVSVVQNSMFFSDYVFLKKGTLYSLSGLYSVSLSPAH